MVQTESKIPIVASNWLKWLIVCLWTVTPKLTWTVFGLKRERTPLIPLGSTYFALQAGILIWNIVVIQNYLGT